MARINRTEVPRQFTKELRMQQEVEKIPEETEDKIRLTYQTNLNLPERREIKVKYVDANDSAGTTIFTSSTSKRTFIVGCNLSVAKDAISTSLHSGIGATPLHMAATTIFRIRYQPLTAGQFNESIVFPFPIEIEKGSAVTVTNNTAVASIDATGLVYYYEVED